MALPMNTGAEAVETAIKLARKWGYRTKGVAQDRAEIVVCRNNFHGRTTTIVGFSSEAQYREDFGPFTPGFTLVDFGDLDALRAAHHAEHRRVLGRADPSRGRHHHAAAGVSRRGPRAVPRAQRAVRARRDPNGLGPDRQDVRVRARARREPDVLVLGKALGGGVYPVSAVLASRAMMTLFRPGDHGSTFGGNPLAAAVGRAALRVLVDERLAERAAEQGEYLFGKLAQLRAPCVAEHSRSRACSSASRSRRPQAPRARICERLAERGVLAKDTHEQVIRLAPPLTVERAELDWLVEQLRAVLG